MQRLHKLLWVALIIAGTVSCAFAQTEDAAAAAPADTTTPNSKGAAAAPKSGDEPAPAGCRTALELIAEQNPQLPVHPVFQKIFNSPDLKGTLFVPTQAAWDEFFATLRQRKGNPESPQLVARYGQVMLYHLAQDDKYRGVKVPIAEATPGVSRFLVSTASTLQCSVGTGLPNNRMLITKTPQAIVVQHGTGNATIRSQAIPYCGGEAYLVNQVLNPCSDISAIMAEVANIPSPCKSNLEYGLMKAGLSSWHALLLATGLSRKMYTSVQPFTMFPFTDSAIEAAYQNGDLDYATLFAKDKGALIGLLAFHAVPMQQLSGPSRATLQMDTLLKEAGNATCGKPKLSWRTDGYVYGGTGSAAVKDGQTGCNTIFYPINRVLQPCCRNLTSLLTGPRGLATLAKNGTMEERSYAFLQEKAAEGGGGRIYFVMPSDTAWRQLQMDAAESRVKITPAMVDGIMEYLYTRAPISNNVVQRSLPVPTGLSRQKEMLAEVCGRLKADGQLRMAFADAAGMAPDTLGNAPGMTPAAGAAAATAPAATGPAAAGAAGVGPAAGAAGMGPAAGAGAMPAAAAGAMPAGAGAVAPMGVAPAAAPGTVVNSLVAGRRLVAEGGLLLPTTFSGGAVAGDTSTGAVDTSPLVGDLLVVDGAAPTLDAAIPVKRQTYACDATIFHVDTVPLPCAFIKRTVTALEEPIVEAPKALPPASFNETTNSTDTNTTTTAKSAAAAATPVLASGLAAVLLGMMLL